LDGILLSRQAVWALDLAYRQKEGDMTDFLGDDLQDLGFISVRRARDTLWIAHNDGGDNPAILGQSNLGDDFSVSDIGSQTDPTGSQATC